IFGPPSLKLTLVENYVHVKLKGPYRWRSSGMKRQSLWKIFPYMVYNVSMYNNNMSKSGKGNAWWEHMILHNDSLILGPLDYESVLCMKAESHSLFLLLTSIHSDWSCITLPSDPFTTQMLVLILGGILPTAICLFVLAAVGGFAYYYIFGHKQRLPSSTDMVQIEEKQKLFQPEKPITIINLNLISTSLSTQESKQRSWGTGDHFISQNECLQPIQALPSGGGEPDEPPPEGEIAQSYAAQAVQHQAGFDSDSDAASDLGSSTGFLNDDYGLVLRERDPQQDMRGSVVPDILKAHVEEPSECTVTAYMAQGEEKDPGEASCEEKGKEEGTFLDWDPQTGVLKIPLLCQLGAEDPTDTEKGAEPKTRVDMELLQRRPILTSVVVRQVSEEISEEDVFSKMEKDWGLQIQTSPQ
ncbi:hypothetical protein NFI96_030943, partial [Prochilodus magdalenae]